MPTESTTWVMVTRPASDARATIADVAREAGVNKGTASRALRGFSGVGQLTRERILEAAERLKFSPSHTATALATGHSKTVGIMLPTLRSWYFAEVASAASEILIPAGFRVELINLDIDAGTFDVKAPNFQRLFHELGAGRGRDALLFIGTIATEPGLPQLRLAKFPGALTGMPLNSVPGIAVDNYGGGQLIGEHLIGLGHRRIAVIEGQTRLKSDESMWLRRTDGLRDALRTAGIALDDSLIITPGDCSPDDGAASMSQLLEADGPRPTAVFCHCDQMAFGALSVLREHGIRCPEEMSVAAFDDHPMSRFWGLTTVSQHAWEQGRRAAQALLEVVDPPEETEDLVREPRPDLRVALIIRQTTAPTNSL